MGPPSIYIFFLLSIAHLIQLGFAQEFFINRCQGILVEPIGNPIPILKSINIARLVQPHIQCCKERPMRVYSLKTLKRISRDPGYCEQIPVEIDKSIFIKNSCGSEPNKKIWYIPCVPLSNIVCIQRQLQSNLGNPNPQLGSVQVQQIAPQNQNNQPNTLQLSSGDSVSNIQPDIPQSANVQPAVFQQVSVQPIVSQSSNVQPIITQQPNIQMSFTQQPNVQPVFSQPPNVQPIFTQQQNVQPIFTQQPNIQPIFSQPPNVQPIFTQQQNCQPIFTQQPIIQPIFTQPPNVQPIFTHPPNSMPTPQPLSNESIRPQPASPQPISPKLIQVPFPISQSCGCRQTCNPSCCQLSCPLPAPKTIIHQQPCQNCYQMSYCNKLASCKNTPCCCSCSQQQICCQPNCCQQTQCNCCSNNVCFLSNSNACNNNCKYVCNPTSNCQSNSQCNSKCNCHCTSQSSSKSNCQCNNNCCKSN